MTFESALHSATNALFGLIRIAAWLGWVFAGCWLIRRAYRKVSTEMRAARRRVLAGWWQKVH
jgi:hypothetical protein